MDPSLTIPDGLDAGAVNLARAIRHRESGGDYERFGDNNTSYGAYQWNNGDTPLQKGGIPANFKSDATTYGLDPNDFSPKNQDMVAYHKIKALKDAGKNVLDIAAIWNHGTDKGWEDAVGDHTYPDGTKVHYDTPAYVKSVNDYYQEMKDKSGDSSTSTQTGPQDDTQAQPETSIGQKILNTAGDISGTRGAGEDIGGALASSANLKDYQDSVASHNQVANDLVTEIQKEEAEGKDTSRLKKSLQTHIDSAPQLSKFMPDVTNKTGAQIAADFATLGLSVGAGALPGGGSVLGRIGGATAIAGAMGATNAISGGSTDAGDIAKQAGIGAVIGVATGGLLEGIGAATKGIKNLITGGHELTAQEIAALKPEDVSKLNQRQQAQYYKTQSKTLTEQATEATTKAKQASEASLQQTKKEISEFQNKTATTIGDKAVELKEPAKQLMKDASSEYIKLSGEAAEGSTALTKTMPHEDLANKIDDKFPDVVNPSNGDVIKDNSVVRDSLKQDLGLKKPIPEVEGKPAPKQPEISNQDILDKARGIMQTVSKTAKQGGKVYSPAEYEAMQKYSFLMETLGENGVDMSAANKFWREYAPVRDRIVREIRPFDETGQRNMPITTTLRQATVTPKTLVQAQTQQKAKAFISELESRMKLPAGSLTKDIAEQINKLEGAELSKANLKKITDETLRQIKLDKVEALKNMSLEKYNNESIALKRARIRKMIGKALTYLGLGVAGKEVLGLIK